MALRLIQENIIRKISNQSIDVNLTSKKLHQTQVETRVKMLRVRLEGFFPDITRFIDALLALVQAIVVANSRNFIEHVCFLPCKRVCASVDLIKVLFVVLNQQLLQISKRSV